MRLLRRNLQPVHYCLLDHVESIHDEWGNETSETRAVYKPAVTALMNASPSSGEVEVEQFINLPGYDRIIVTDDMSCPIDKNTVIFVEKDPEYDQSGNPLYDYVVNGVAKSLNSIAYAVSEVDVS